MFLGKKTRFSFFRVLCCYQTVIWHFSCSLQTKETQYEINTNVLSPTTISSKLYCKKSNTLLYQPKKNSDNCTIFSFEGCHKWCWKVGLVVLPLVSGSPAVSTCGCRFIQNRTEENNSVQNNNTQLCSPFNTNKYKRSFGACWLVGKCFPKVSREPDYQMPCCTKWAIFIWSTYSNAQVTSSFFCNENVLIFSPRFILLTSFYIKRGQRLFLKLYPTICFSFLPWDTPLHFERQNSSHQI